MSIYTRDNILKDLREHTIMVTLFDGQRARVTLQSREVPRYVEQIDAINKFHEDNPTLVAAWDTFRRCWQKIDIDSVQYVERHEAD